MLSPRGGGGRIFSVASEDLSSSDVRNSVEVLEESSEGKRKILRMLGLVTLGVLAVIAAGCIVKFSGKQAGTSPVAPIQTLRAKDSQPAQIPQEPPKTVEVQQTVQDAAKDLKAPGLSSRDSHPARLSKIDSNGAFAVPDSPEPDSVAQRQGDVERKRADRLAEADQRRAEITEFLRHGQWRGTKAKKHRDRGPMRDGDRPLAERLRQEAELRFQAANPNVSMPRLPEPDYGPITPALGEKPEQIYGASSEQLRFFCPHSTKGPDGLMRGGVKEAAAANKNLYKRQLPNPPTHYGDKVEPDWKVNRWRDTDRERLG